MAKGGKGKARPIKKVSSGPESGKLKKAKPKRPIKSKKKKKNSSIPLNIFYWLAAILVLTVVVYFPSLDNDFTNWDDPSLIIDNPLIRSIEFENIKRIFSEYYFGNYQPLHILSYAIEYHFFGLNAPDYHMVSLIMHLIIVSLVMVFTWQLTEDRIATLVATLLFAIHPLHVESVAWATERKDLLYTLFFVASLICYVRYIKKGLELKYLVYAFLLMLIAIFSKAMAASLAPTLILVDYFYKRKLNLRLVLEKIPFFALSIIFGLISIDAARSTSSIDETGAYPFHERFFFASHNFLSYIAKLIVPIDLSAFYPYPVVGGETLPWMYYAALPTVILLVVAVILSYKSGRKIIFGFFFFSITIFLVLMLIPIGPTIFSERYSYIPSIGLNYLLGLGFVYLFVTKAKEIPALKTISAAVLIMYSAWLCYGTYERCKVWKNSETLWTDVIEQFPQVALAHNNLGNFYGKNLGMEELKKGNSDEAKKYFDRAMEKYIDAQAANPKYSKSYCNMGIVYAMRGEIDKAIENFNIALEYEPGYLEAIKNRGIAHAQSGQYEKAVADFNLAMEKSPRDADNFFNRGMAYLQDQKYQLALDDFNQAIIYKPDYADAYYRRSTAQYALGSYIKANQDLETSIRMGSRYDQQFYNAVKQKAGIR
ncbi:MAG: tetratricopeptide repeat protein [Bacteroidia bacterium]|nr:tetratricopeptide repeat protein [Bacteroidia bacterium]